MNRFPISEFVRGSRTICLKARIKGRNDGEGSFLAQFLRTSEIPGHLDLRDTNVFELRASAEEFPFVRLEASVDGGESWWAVSFEDDGRFRLENRFKKAGEYTVRLRAHVDGDLSGRSEQDGLDDLLRLFAQVQARGADKPCESGPSGFPGGSPPSPPASGTGRSTSATGLPSQRLEIHGDETVSVEHPYKAARLLPESGRNSGTRRAAWSAGGPLTSRRAGLTARLGAPAIRNPELPRGLTAPGRVVAPA